MSSSFSDRNLADGERGKAEARARRRAIGDEDSALSDMSVLFEDTSLDDLYSPIHFRSPLGKARDLTAHHCNDNNDDDGNGALSVDEVTK
ncbi:hypothetical protein BASA81_004190 [Batrachochytrium salamandrivorans]|nr:hypothetical protein BASA81_004190 [Batrachochytrium salamandrivorans]